jgi:hypothetical protein
MATDSTVSPLRQRMMLQGVEQKGVRPHPHGMVDGAAVPMWAGRGATPQNQSNAPWLTKVGRGNLPRAETGSAFPAWRLAIRPPHSLIGF